MPRPSITAIVVASLACLAGAPAAGESRSEPGVVVVRGISAGDLLNLRATASATGIVLGRLPNGTALRLENCDKVGSYRWCRVEVADETGLRGWTPARYLHDPDTQLTMDEALAAREPAEGRVAEGDGGTGAPPPVSPEDLGAELLAPRASTRSGPDLTQTVLLSALAAREGPGADLLTAFDGRREAASIDAARDALARSVTARVDPSAVELYTLTPAAEAASAPEPGEGVAAPGIPIPTPRPDSGEDTSQAVASLPPGLTADDPAPAGTNDADDAPTGAVQPARPLAEAEPPLAAPTETARTDGRQPSGATAFAAAVETALDRLALAPSTPTSDATRSPERQPTPAAETALDRLASAPPIPLDADEPAAGPAPVDPPQPPPDTAPPASAALSPAPSAPPASAAPSPAPAAVPPASAALSPAPAASADPRAAPATPPATSVAPPPAPATPPRAPDTASVPAANPSAIADERPAAVPAPRHELAPPAGAFVVAQAPAAGAPFDATATIPCARYLGQPMTRCEAGITRTGPDASDVTVNWPDGGTRVIRFRDGQPEGANTRGEFRFTREADLHMIRVGTGERFEIPDALAFGE